MRDVGRAVEEGVDAVATVRLDGAAVSALGQLLDDGAVVLEGSAGLGNGNGRVQAVAGGLDNADGVGVCQGFLADIVRLVNVAVEASVVEGDVDVDNVAVLQDALIGNTVADALVHAGAHRLGEVAVVEWRGVGLASTKSCKQAARQTDRPRRRTLEEQIGKGEESAHISFYACFVDDFVNRVSGDAGLQGSGGNVEDLTGEAADLAHAFLLGLVEDGDLVAANKDLLGTRDAILCVVGTLDVCWQFPTR